MSTRSRIPRRKRIFLGCEGASVGSFVTWLGRLCDENDLHLHLDQYNAGGGDGDGESVVRRSLKERSRRVQNDGAYYRSMILLDSDRLQADLRAGRDPRVLEGIVPLVWLRPNLEGLLVRLHEGHEKRDI